MADTVSVGTSVAGGEDVSFLSYSILAQVVCTGVLFYMGAGVVSSVMKRRGLPGFKNLAFDVYLFCVFWRICDISYWFYLPVWKARWGTKYAFLSFATSKRGRTAGHLVVLDQRKPKKAKDPRFTFTLHNTYGCAPKETKPHDPAPKIPKAEPAPLEHWERDLLAIAKEGEEPKGKDPQGHTLSSVVRIAAVSDVHTRWSSINVPALVDVLIVSGDILLMDPGEHRGNGEELLEKFNKWLGSLTHVECKIADSFQLSWACASGQIQVIAGNHDQTLEDIGRKRAQEILSHAIYLEHDLLEVHFEGRGTMRLFGSPMSAYGGTTNKSFQMSPRESAAHWTAVTKLLDSHSLRVLKSPGKKTENVAKHLDILVTHGMPRGHRDKGSGDRKMKQVIGAFRPKFHVFGHKHSGYGIDFAKRGTTYINASSLNGLYTPVHLPIGKSFVSRVNVRSRIINQSLQSF